METKNNGAVQNGTAKAATKTLPAAEVKKEQVNGKTEAGKSKPDQLKDEQPSGPQPGEQQEPKTETVAVKEAPLPATPVLNLENRLKVVDDLHRKSVQRVNLKSRITQLETFEVALSQEHDELDDNPYQGCKLIIKDDRCSSLLSSTDNHARQGFVQ